MIDDTQKPDASQGEAEIKPAVEVEDTGAKDVEAVKGVDAKPKTPARKPRVKPARKARVKERKGVGFLTAFVMMLFAAVGGAVLSQLYNFYGPAQEQGVSAARVQALEAKFEALPAEPKDANLTPFIARIEALETRPTALSTGEAGVAPVIPADIEGRLAALENKDVPSLEAVEARLTALETVTPTEPVEADAQVTDAQVTEDRVSDEWVSRLEALETASDVSGLEERVNALQANVDTPQEVSPELLERLQILEGSVQALPAPVDLSSVEARIAALETEAQNLKLTQADVIKATTPIPPFPSEAVLKALENTDVKSDKGWLGKTLDKYVLADNAEAIKTVSRVELLLQQGRVDAALEQVQSLPEPAQVAAQDWINAVNARRR